MASGVASQIKEEFLVCQICFEDYETPKALPCQHTFCQTCLEKMAAAMKTLNCPNCRQLCHLPKNGVEGLPTSIFVNKLRDIIKFSSPPSHRAYDDRSSYCNPCRDLGSNGGMTANRAYNLGPGSDTARTSARHRRLAPVDRHSRRTPNTVLLSSGRYDAIDDFFIRLCSSRFLHPDRVLPILSWLKEQDIMTAQDLHDNWDDVRNMVDMTNAMRQHISEALGEFSQPGL